MSKGFKRASLGGVSSWGQLGTPFFQSIEASMAKIGDMAAVAFFGLALIGLVLIWSQLWLLLPIGGLWTFGACFGWWRP